jgi:hypothetical protein
MLDVSAIPKRGLTVKNGAARSRVEHAAQQLLLSPRAGDGKYPPAEPGALGCEPLKAAVRDR